MPGLLLHLHTLGMATRRRSSKLNRLRIESRFTSQKLLSRRGLGSSKETGPINLRIVVDSSFRAHHGSLAYTKGSHGSKDRASLPSSSFGAAYVAISNGNTFEIQLGRSQSHHRHTMQAGKLPRILPQTRATLMQYVATQKALWRLSWKLTGCVVSCSPYHLQSMQPKRHRSTSARLDSGNLLSCIFGPIEFLGQQNAQLTCVCRWA